MSEQKIVSGTGVSSMSSLGELNDETVSVETCVWPDCSASLTVYRFGPLCVDHGMDFHLAMAEQQSRSVTDAMVKAVERQKQEQARAESRRRSRGEQPGWVYYILIADRVKIGFSTDVRQRMRQYPPGSELLAVHPGTLRLEAEMHRRFAGSRTAGREWFTRSTDLLEHVEQVVKQFGDPREHRYHFRGARPPLIRPRTR